MDLGSGRSVLPDKEPLCNPCQAAQSTRRCMHPLNRYVFVQAVPRSFTKEYRYWTLCCKCCKSTFEIYE